MKTNISKYLKQYGALILLLVCFFAFAQGQRDTVPKEPKPPKEKSRNPTTATLMSMAVPGLGQVYNKKYWKLPIIYGGLGFLYYNQKTYHNDYLTFKEAYLFATDDDSTTVPDSYFENMPDADIQYWRDKYRKTRDLNRIFMVLLYIMNVVDASVDAHLFNYDVGDDLSLQIMPAAIIRTPFVSTVGIRCNLYF